MTDVIELLKKIQKLAQNGVGGEKVNAQVKLRLLMKRHNITEADLCEETPPKEEYLFSYKNEHEKKLLLQVVAWATDDRSVKIFQVFDRKTERKKQQLGFLVSAQDNMLIREAFDYYRKEFKVQIDLLFSAFVQKHQLYFTPQQYEPCDMNEDDVMAVLRMAESITSKQFNNKKLLTEEV
ncbi:MAG: hypothetical protein JXM68_07030 [Sedimentisphaerales bacterium]|nr:hypothetical protein [Sedimentisphaerales bacterium]